jgi:hypothetical protein
MDDVKNSLSAVHTYFFQSTCSIFKELYLCQVEEGAHKGWLDTDNSQIGF